jgi:hypothetical protein
MPKRPTPFCPELSKAQGTPMKDDVVRCQGSACAIWASDADRPGWGRCGGAAGDQFEDPALASAPPAMPELCGQVGPISPGTTGMRPVCGRVAGHEGTHQAGEIWWGPDEEDRT